MPKTLIINSTPFDYPTSGDAPGWGNDATGWAEEVTKVLNNLVGPDDILETSFNIANDQSTDANVTGLVFNAGSVRSAVIQYAIYRISDSNPSGFAETGEMHLVYDNNDGWNLGLGGIVGNSGVTFTITPAGQIQYQSNDIGSVSYTGVMKFTAKSLQQ